MANIVYLVDNYAGSASTWYRGRVPGMALKDCGHRVTLTNVPVSELMDDCDVLVLLHRGRSGALEVVQHVNGRGMLTVFDADDDYWSVHPENPNAQLWTAERRRVVAAVARACKVMTVSTHALAGVMASLNRNIAVVENMLPASHWPRERKRITKGDRVVLGWAGSPSHAADLRIVVPLLQQLLDEYPRLEVKLAGAPEHWRASHPRIETLPWVEIEHYASVLAGFDVALAPLADTRFNRCKSDLKFVEYGMVGLAVVASQVGPYRTAVRHGENGFLARNPKDWLKYLRNLIEDAGLRDRVGAAARAFAQTRLVSDNIGNWESAYRLGGDGGRRRAPAPTRGR